MKLKQQLVNHGSSKTRCHKRNGTDQDGCGSCQKSRVALEACELHRSRAKILLFKAWLRDGAHLTQLIWLGQPGHRLCKCNMVVVGGACGSKLLHPHSPPCSCIPRVCGMLELEQLPTCGYDPHWMIHARSTWKNNYIFYTGQIATLVVKCNRL